MGLNHPETIGPAPGPCEDRLPGNQPLMPKRLGGAVLADPWAALLWSLFKWRTPASLLHREWICKLPGVPCVWQSKWAHAHFCLQHAHFICSFWHLAFRERATLVSWNLERASREGYSETDSLFSRCSVSPTRKSPASFTTVLLQHTSLPQYQNIEDQCQWGDLVVVWVFCFFFFCCEACGMLVPWT